MSLVQRNIHMKNEDKTNILTLQTVTQSKSYSRKKTKKFQMNE